MADDLGRHLGALDQRGPDLHIAAEIQRENVGHLYRLTDLAPHPRHANPVAFRDPVLKPPGSYHSVVHDSSWDLPSLFSGHLCHKLAYYTLLPSSVKLQLREREGCA